MADNRPAGVDALNINQQQKEINDKKKASITASLNSIIDSQSFNDYLGSLSKDNLSWGESVFGKKLAPVLNMTLLNRNFWKLLLTNITAIIGLASAYMSDPDLFSEALPASRERLYAKLTADNLKNLQALFEVIGDITNIPDKAENSLLDRQFIGEILGFGIKLAPNITSEINTLVKALKPGADPALYNKAVIALLKKAVEGTDDRQNLADLLMQKKGPISKILAKGLSKNSTGLIDSAEIQAVLEKIITKDNIGAILDTVEQTFDKDAVEATSIVTKLLGNELHSVTKDLLAIDNLLPALCFEAKEQKDAKSVVYKLSSIGKQLESLGLIKMADGTALEPTIAITIPGEAKLDENGKVEKVTVTKEQFKAGVLNKFNFDLLKELPRDLFAKQETVQQLGDVISDFSQGKAALIYTSKALKMLEQNKELTATLGKHKEQVATLVKAVVSEETLQPFGLKKDFLDILVPALKDHETIASVEEIVTQLAAGNTTQMVTEAFIVLDKNQELADFAQKPEITKQIAALVASMGGSVEMMREYLDRYEFKPLEDKLQGSLEAVLPSALGLILKPENQLLETLDLSMQCGAIQAGFMLGERVSNLADRTAVEASSKELYLLLTQQASLEENKGKSHLELIQALDLKKAQLAKLSPLGITDLAGLKSELTAGVFNMAGNELYNQFDLVFKTDFPAEQQEAKKSIIDRMKSERDSALEILSGGFNDDFAQIGGGKTFDEAIDEAVASKTLSRDNALMLKQVFTKYNDAVSAIDNGTAKLCARFKHEVQIRGLESELQGVHSDALFLLSKQIESGVDLNLDQVKAIITDKSLVLPESIAEILMNGRESVSSDDLKSKLNDIACRQQGSEGVGNLQDMLSGVLAPFSAIIGESADKGEQLTATLNKLLNGTSDNPTMLASVQRVILEKGTQESQADVIVEAIGEIFAGDKYTAEEKVLLADKVVKPILRQIIPTTSVLNAIEKVVDVVKVSEESAIALYNNPKMKGVLTNILKQEWSSFAVAPIDLMAYGVNKVFGVSDEKNKADLTKILVTLGLSSLTSIVGQFAWSTDVDSSPEVTGKFKDHLDALRAQTPEGQKVDVRAILRKDLSASGLHALSGKDLSGINLSNAKLEGIVFEKTKFGDVNLQNSEFSKCYFNACVIPQGINLAGATFDVQSFESFVANAKYLDLNKLLADVKVISNVTEDPVDARLVYGLIQFSKAKRVKFFSQEMIADAIKLGIKYDDLLLFAGNGSDYMKSSFDDIELSGLSEKLTEQGLTKEVLKKFSEQIRTGKFELPADAKALDKLQIQCVEGMLNRRYNPLYSDTIKCINAILLQGKADQTNAIIAGTFIDNFWGASVSSETLNVLKLCADKLPSLDESQQKDLIAFFKVNKDLDPELLQTAFDQFIAILQSPDYAKIAEIADKFPSDNAGKVALYHDLAGKGEKLEEYQEIVAGFSATKDLKSLAGSSMSEILKQWYLNRAADKMKPESARGGYDKTIPCIDKALEYSKQEDELASNIAKKTVLKLFGERYLTTPDRLDDAEKIYNATVELVNSLDQESRDKLSSLDIDTLVGDTTKGLCGLLYPKTSREMTSLGDVYLSAEFTVAKVKEFLETKLSNEGILVEAIIQKESSLEKHRSELEKLNLDVLKVIDVNTAAFAARSKVKVIPGMLLNSEDRRLHDDMYSLDAGNLTALLNAKQAIFDEAFDYSQRSGKSLSAMVPHLDVLENLHSLSNELVARYTLTGNTQSEKLCLNLAVKTYNNNEQVRELIATPEGRTILANVFFPELQKLAIERPPVDLSNLEASSTAVCSKLTEVQTAEFAKHCSAQGLTIAEGVFAKLQIAETWNDEAKTQKSIDNLADILAARIFVSGQALENVDVVIGDAKPGVGVFTNKYSQSTGLVKEFKDIFYSSVSMVNPWYEVGKFDTKDNHTSRLIKGFDGLINPQSQSQVR